MIVSSHRNRNKKAEAPQKNERLASHQHILTASLSLGVYGMSGLEPDSEEVEL